MFRVIQQSYKGKKNGNLEGKDNPSWKFPQNIWLFRSLMYLYMSFLHLFKAFLLYQSLFSKRLRSPVLAFNIANNPPTLMND